MNEAVILIEKQLQTIQNQIKGLQLQAALAEKKKKEMEEGLKQLRMRENNLVVAISTLRGE
jgi:hypothetical protein